MHEPWEIVKALETDNSRLGKEAIIKGVANSNNGIFFKGARLALDPMITFGLKQVPEKQDDTGDGLRWDLFQELVDALSRRIATGNNARALVDHAMSIATLEQWNSWYRRILIKDLRCGVSEKTINKVVEKINDRYIIPVFGCQLAHDSANHETKVSGQKLIEVKLDGVRVITIAYPGGHVDQYSRNGKELVNFEHIKEQIAQVVKQDAMPDAIVFDGEVMSSSFQDLMKQVHRKDNVAAGDAVLNLFDVIPLNAFNEGICSVEQSHRSNSLVSWYQKHQDLMPNVTVVGQELVDLDTAAGQEKFKEINQLAIAGGYEGIMIKDPEAPYECKRTASWLKLKPFIEVSLSVTGVEGGTGRNTGRLGALLCEGSENGKQITVNVGSGFSDADRDSFYSSRDNLLGQIVEVRADAITQNQDGSYSLRFPRFLRFRGFVPGEKL